MISVESVQFQYGETPLLNQVSLRVPERTTCAVVGPSGCGKSTLLHLLAGLLHPANGVIAVDGRPLLSPRNRTGLILQDGGLLPWKTALDNAALGLLARGVPRDEARQRARETMGELGIGARADAYPAQMSGGEKQRTAIARALILEPDLLLLDEAAASLDAVTRERIQELLLAIFAARNLTMVVVTHSIDEAVALGQKIAILSRGAILAEIDNPAFRETPDRASADFVRLCDDLRHRLREEDHGGTE